MIRIMLVDDSAFMRKLTTSMLAANPDISIVKEAKNGEEAIQNYSDDIDIVLLDIEMPKKTGLEVLEEWHKANKKVTTIMFSSLTKNGASETIRALNLGAFDFIEKPNNPILLNQKKDEIIDKIKFAYQHKQKRRITTLQRPQNASPSLNNRVDTIRTSTMFNPPTQQSSAATPTAVKNIILIGCSTGGPRALKEIMPMFPRNLNGAILIVQHMPKGDYTRSLSETLNRVSPLQVQEAQNGQQLQNGNVYIAPGGYQMKINASGSIVIVEDPPESGHAPSVDYMFREVFNKKGSYRLLPVVLTGMGGDGSKSSLLFSNAGIETIVESEQSCVVFGMPKKVIEIGSKNKVLDLEDIPRYIIGKLN